MTNYQKRRQGERMNFRSNERMKPRPPTTAELVGMSNLLSALRKARELAAVKPCLASIQPDGDTYSN